MGDRGELLPSRDAAGRGGAGDRCDWCRRAPPTFVVRGSVAEAIPELRPDERTPGLCKCVCRGCDVKLSLLFAAKPPDGDFPDIPYAEFERIGDHVIAESIAGFLAVSIHNARLNFLMHQLQSDLDSETQQSHRLREEVDDMQLAHELNIGELKKDIGHLKSDGRTGVNLQAVHTREIASLNSAITFPHGPHLTRSQEQAVFMEVMRRVETCALLPVGTALSFNIESGAIEVTDASTTESAKVVDIFILYEDEKIRVNIKAHRLGCKVVGIMDRHLTLITDQVKHALTEQFATPGTNEVGALRPSRLSSSATLETERDKSRSPRSR